MTFREAERHLNSRVMFGMKLGLRNIRRMLRRLGNPEKSFKSIHIAGTNGKGSTAAILASVLSALGYKTGLYTSPHIATVRERFQVDGSQIDRSDFARIYARLLPHFDTIPCTYFECTTAMAFLWFREQNVDIAVIETGLGGRFDATNVIKPVCSVITTIGFDHQEHLGNTLPEITREKCGIIKKGIPVVSGVEQPECKRIIKAAAARRHSSYFEADYVVRVSHIRVSISGNIFNARIKQNKFEDISFPLAGAFQIKNARTALAVMTVLQDYGISLDWSCILNGLRSVCWPYRFSLVHRDPVILIDVAHNEPGFSVMQREIRKLFPEKNLLLVVGMKSDKDCEKALKPILPLCRAGIGIPVHAEKGVSRRNLAKTFEQEKIPFTYFRSVRAGVRFACEQAGRDDVIVCAGSHYCVNAVKKVVNSLD